MHFAVCGSAWWSAAMKVTRTDCSLNYFHFIVTIKTFPAESSASGCSTHERNEEYIPIEWFASRSRADRWINNFLINRNYASPQLNHFFSALNTDCPTNISLANQTGAHKAIQSAITGSMSIIQLPTFTHFLASHFAATVHSTMSSPSRWSEDTRCHAFD